jgi:two-component system, response regulator PdtaR
MVASDVGLLSKKAKLEADGYRLSPGPASGTALDCIRWEWMSGTEANARPIAIVVDDEALLRMYASDLFEEEGFAVLAAADADATLNILEARPDVRLLFTDIQMPGGCDGMDLARKVHARWPNVLLVITSGNEKPSTAEILDDGRFSQTLQSRGTYCASGRFDAKALL